MSCTGGKDAFDLEKLFINLLNSNYVLHVAGKLKDFSD